MKVARCRGRKKDGYRCSRFGPGDSSTVWFCNTHDGQDDVGGWLQPPSLGGLACDFIEELCCHGPGDVLGEDVKLMPEEIKFIYELYELDPDAERIMRYMAVMCRAKGFRKTELLGWLGCFELMGPCRPDGFDADGELVGRPVKAARVGSVATEEGQAGESFGVGTYICGERLSDHYRLDVLADEIRMMDGSKSEWGLMTSRTNSKDGAKTTALLLDEPHLWTTPGLHKLYSMVMRQLVKRKSGGLAIAATTAWRPGQGSVAEAAYDTFMKDPGGGVLFDLRMAPDGIDDLSDKKQVMAGLEYAYGDAHWVPLERIYETEFKPIGTDPTKTEGDARRYFFNQPTAPESKFIPNMAAWKALGPADGETARVVPARAKVILGFDGSKTGDSTQLVGYQVDSDPPFVFEVGSWERPSELEWDEKWEVPRSDVEDRVAWAASEWRVVGLVMDPAFWQQSRDKWAKSLNVVEFNFSSAAQMGKALDLFLEIVGQEGLGHDGSDTIYRHLSNAVRDTRGSGGREGQGFTSVRKDSPQSREWIDAAIAVVLAVWGGSLEGLVGRLNVVERTWVNRDVPDVVDDGVKDRRAKLRAAYL